MLDIPTITDNEAPEFVTIDGRRYLKGRNGKLWQRPPVTYYYRELYEAMSATFYGHPKLNDAEQDAYETVLPFLCKMSDEAEEQFDGLADGEVSCMIGGRPAIELSPADTAYRIAEELIALGWTPPAK